MFTLLRYSNTKHITNKHTNFSMKQLNKIFFLLITLCIKTQCGEQPPHDPIQLHYWVCRQGIETYLQLSGEKDGFNQKMRKNVITSLKNACVKILITHGNFERDSSKQLNDFLYAFIGLNSWERNPEKVITAPLPKIITCVQKLLDSNASPNVPVDFYTHLNSSIAEILLAAKADPNATDEFGNQPINYIYKQTKTFWFKSQHVMPEPTIKALLKAKADPNHEDTEGRSPLSTIVRATPPLENAITIVSLLMEARANPLQRNIKDYVKHSALEIAAQEGKYDLVAIMQPPTQTHRRCILQ